MLVLFCCIAIGFLLAKLGILPDNAGKTVAKLVTWVFTPALNFITMARYFTVKSLVGNLELIIIGTVTVAVAVFVAITLSKVFVRSKSPERGIYQYALTFANFGFLGDPLVLAIFGEPMLFCYKLFTLPMTVVAYTWGMSVLIPKKQGGSVLANLFNPPFIALLLGMLVGITGLTPALPAFAVNTLESLKACYGPLAMLLVGITVAHYNLSEMLVNKKVYVATLTRLVLLPAVYVTVASLAVLFLDGVFSLGIGTTVLFLMFFAYAGPLGMNTIVFPEAYGGNPKTGASMAIISHPLSVITIPLLYALMVLILGAPVV